MLLGLGLGLLAQNCCCQVLWTKKMDLSSLPNKQTKNVSKWTITDNIRLKKEGIKNTHYPF